MYISKDYLERDCSDFRAFDHTPHCCKFGDTCTGPSQQRMFVDNFYGIDGQGFCTGVNDESKKRLLEKICTGKPIRLSAEKIEEINESIRRRWAILTKFTDNL